MKYRLFVIILMLAACGFSTSDSMSLPRVELDVNMCVTNIRDELYVITVLTNTSDTVLNLDVEYSGLKGVLHQNPYTVRVSGKEIHSVSGGPVDDYRYSDKRSIPQGQSYIGFISLKNSFGVEKVSENELEVDFFMYGALGQNYDKIAVFKKEKVVYTESCKF